MVNLLFKKLNRTAVSQYNIPIIAFQKNLHCPEAKSKLCEKIITFNTNHELTQKLVLLSKSLSKSLSKRPVLFIASDIYVEYYLNNRSIIDQYYDIHFPDSNIAFLLLNKKEFQVYGEKNNLPLPKSFSIQSENDIVNINKNVIFPIILKPFLRNEEWNSKRYSKAYILNTPKELTVIYNKVKSTDNNLIAQEWIPGPDSNIEYCLVYFDENSNCISYFTGVKIRQWPVGAGSTASTKPVFNPKLFKTTLKIFSDLCYRGFGSIEYKKHEITGKYYIMEPTVGRPNLQSYVSTANGENMPLKSYESLTGIKFKHKKIKNKNVKYVRNWFDIFSTIQLFMRKEISLLTYLNSLKGPKKYSFLNKTDLTVYLHSYFDILNRILKRTMKENN